MFRTQRNARVHLVAAVAVVAAGQGLDLATGDWLWIVAAIVAVFAAEAFNTALESLADAVHPETHPLIKRAKDAAAGAVLMTAIGAALIGCVVFWPYVSRLFLF